MMRNGKFITVMLVMLGLCLALSACAGNGDAEAYTPAPTTPPPTLAPSGQSVTDTENIPDNIPNDNNPNDDNANRINPFEINPNSPHWDDILNSDGILVIDEPYFAEWIQVIHMNRELFVGRTLQFEGFYMSMIWDDGEVIHSVARFAARCCGLHGFEIYLNETPQPPEETWVIATGILEEFFIEGIEVAFLRVNILEMVAR